VRGRRTTRKARTSEASKFGWIWCVCCGAGAVTVGADPVTVDVGGYVSGSPQFVSAQSPGAVKLHSWFVLPVHWGRGQRRGPGGRGGRADYLVRLRRAVPVGSVKALTAARDCEVLVRSIVPPSRGTQHPVSPPSAPPSPLLRQAGIARVHFRGPVVRRACAGIEAELKALEPHGQVVAGHEHPVHELARLVA
jgi:hypothetical protein